MLDDDAIEIWFDSPDANTVYRNYLETCRHAGVEPVSRERAEGLIAKWTGGPSVPPTAH